MSDAALRELLGAVAEMLEALEYEKLFACRFPDRVRRLREAHEAMTG